MRNNSWYLLVLSALVLSVGASAFAEEDGVEISWKQGERRDYRIQIDETTTSAGGGVNVKDDYPQTLYITTVTEAPTENGLIPVTLTLTRYQGKLPELGSDFVKRTFEFDSAIWQRNTKLPNIYFTYYAAQLSVPLKLLFKKSGELAEVQGSKELTAELERLLKRDFLDEPSFANTIQSYRTRCHQNTLKMQWENLLTLAFPEDFEPEKEWKTEPAYFISGGYFGWIKGKHSAIEGEKNGFKITSDYDFPRTQATVQKQASGSENEYFVKSGTGKGTMLRGADGWSIKHSRELHIYVSNTLRFSGAAIPIERYSKYSYTIERVEPKP